MLCANTHTLLNLPCCHTLGHVQGYTSKCLDKVKTNCRAFPTSKRKPRRPKRYIVARLCLQIKSTFCMRHITKHPDLVGLTHSLEQPLEWRNDKLDWKGQPSFRRPPYVVSAVSSIVLLYSYNYIRRRLNPDNEDITGVKACDTSGRLWTWKDPCSPGRIRLPIKGYFRLPCLKSGPSRLMQFRNSSACSTSKENSIISVVWWETKHRSLGTYLQGSAKRKMKGQQH